MPFEIERKFLVVIDLWDAISKPEPILIKQGYIAGNNTVSVRVRMQNGMAVLNIKKIIDIISRYEFEYQIPFTEGEILLDKVCSSSLEKWRYIMPTGQHTWEVDVFLGRNQGLIVAELELQERDEAYIKPDWVGEEVTLDPRYLNTSLAQKPFDSWH